MRVGLRGKLFGVIAACILAVGAWAALAPVVADSPTRSEVFEIPKGTWARRMSGDKVDILPNQIRLTLGIRDVLVLRNNDDVPQWLLADRAALRRTRSVTASERRSCR